MTAATRRFAYLTVCLAAGCGVEHLDLGRNRPQDAGTLLDGSLLVDGSSADAATLRDAGDVGPSVNVNASTRLFLNPYASCALAEDGYIACLGVGDRGQLAVPLRYFETDCEGRACTYEAREANVFQALDVALTDLFGCAAIGDGVFCFGNNELGQLGRGTRDTEPHPDPEYVSLDGWDPVHIAVGTAHACALSSDGRVDCWGFGSHGQLGTDPADLTLCGQVASESEAARLGLTVGDSIRCSPLRVRVPGIIDGVAIGAGGHGTCVVRATGELRCFGDNRAGELGLDQVQATFKPLPSTLSEVKTVSLSGQHGCAITADERVHCWGSDAYGQLGLTEPSSDVCSGVACARAPRRTVFVGARQLALGARSTLVLRRDARVFGVGDASEGQLGDGASMRDVCSGAPCAKTPVEVALSSGAFTVAAAGAHACAVLEGNQIVCWGRGSEGQTGNSFLEGSPLPMPVDLRIR